MSPRGGAAIGASAAADGRAAAAAGRRDRDLVVLRRAACVLEAHLEDVEIIHARELAASQLVNKWASAAGVPLLRGRDKLSLVLCDLSVNNLLAVHNSRLVGRLLCNSRLRAGDRCAPTCRWIQAVAGWCTLSNTGPSSEG